VSRKAKDAPKKRTICKAVSLIEKKKTAKNRQKITNPTYFTIKCI